MAKEYGLMIIWNNARKYEDEIIKDVKKRFVIRNKFEIIWEPNIFSENLSRFYGENLPKKSFKEKHCGNGPFVLLILEDNNPIYNYRPTSHGKLKVNVNFFDSKEMYRKFAGQHRIHATNDLNEFKHDLMLLLGLNIADFEKKYNKSEKLVTIKKDIIGYSGWKDLKEIFYVLNETTDYVVLRNYEYLPKKYELGEHSDIDILCRSQENIIKILKGTQYYKNKKRAKYKIRVNNSYINFDLRYVGDNYYDPKWEDAILNNKEIYNEFYIPSKNDHNYSLIYHALIHKKRIANDYREKLNINNQDDQKNRFLELKKFMDENDYKFVYPKDYSVFYNDLYLSNKIDFKRKVYFKLYKYIAFFERRYK